MLLNKFWSCYLLLKSKWRLILTPCTHSLSLLLIVCFICSQGKAAIPVLWQFFEKWDSPEVTRSADWKPIAELLHPLGLHEKRAKMLIRFSGSHFTLQIKKSLYCQAKAYVIVFSHTNVLQTLSWRLFRSSHYLNNNCFYWIVLESPLSKTVWLTNVCRTWQH